VSSVVQSEVIAKLHPEVQILSSSKILCLEIASSNQLQEHIDIGLVAQCSSQKHARTSARSSQACLAKL
jgi:hypothetical protein